MWQTVMGEHFTHHKVIKVIPLVTFIQRKCCWHWQTKGPAQWHQRTQNAEHLMCPPATRHIQTLFINKQKARWLNVVRLARTRSPSTNVLLVKKRWQMRLRLTGRLSDDKAASDTLLMDHNITAHWFATCSKKSRNVCFDLSCNGRAFDSPPHPHSRAEPLGSHNWYNSMRSGF